MYLCNGRVHACKTRKALELNIGHEGIKWLMVEAAARHAEVVHYSTSAEMRVGSDDGRKTKDFGFWPLVLEGVTGVRLRKEESNHTERRVREVTRWHDPVDEKTGFMEAACQNYEVLVEDKRVGKTGGARPSQRYETRFGLK